MEIDLSQEYISEVERREINALLAIDDKNESDDLEQIWYLMDLVWDKFHCDSRYPLSDNVVAFYRHPVWLLNGLFIEQDVVSMGHRQAITKWASGRKFKNVLDYGGGFGTLAKLIAEKVVGVHVDIFEPHPSEYMVKRSKKFNNISIIDNLNYKYDCLVSTDVLEHVPDPLHDFAEMIHCVNFQGYLVIANAFYPMIKCHLPQSFHFRYTFNIFAKLMGLEIIGPLDGSHATIFRKIESKTINWRLVRFFEYVSKIFYSLVNILKPVIRPVKNLF